MAKETKAQRMERLEAEHATRVAADASLYVERLASVLEFAQTFGFTLTVRERKLCVSHPEYSDVKLGMYHTEDHQTMLEGLEYYVKCEEERQLREAFRAQLISAALTKLSAAEQEVLGL